MSIGTFVTFIGNFSFFFLFRFRCPSFSFADSIRSMQSCTHSRIDVAINCANRFAVLSDYLIKHITIAKTTIILNTESKQISNLCQTFLILLDICCAALLCSADGCTAQRKKNYIHEFLSLSHVQRAPIHSTNDS